jgi:hypothetical protein
MLIAESDTKWEERIKNERFCWHNAQWLEAIAKTNLLSSPGNNLISTSTQSYPNIIRLLCFQELKMNTVSLAVF